MFPIQGREGLPPDNVSLRKLGLFQISVQKLLLLGIRTWVNDRGNTFQIHPSSSDGFGFADSEVAVTGGSLRNVVNEVDTIFRALKSLYDLGIQDLLTPAPEITELQETSLLKELISTTRTLWRGLRYQSRLRTRSASDLRDYKMDTSDTSGP